MKGAGGGIQCYKCGEWNHLAKDCLSEQEGRPFKDRSAIPCKHFARSQCWAGDDCRYMHGTWSPKSGKGDNQKKRGRSEGDRNEWRDNSHRTTEEERRCERFWEQFTFDKDKWDTEDETLARDRPYEWQNNRSWNSLMAESKRRSRNHAGKRGTIHRRLGCSKEFTGEDEGESEHRLARHMGDTSANEQILYPEEPTKQLHISANFWKQITACWKKDEFYRVRRAGHGMEDERRRAGHGSSSSGDRYYQRNDGHRMGRGKGR